MKAGTSPEAGVDELISSLVANVLSPDDGVPATTIIRAPEPLRRTPWRERIRGVHLLDPAKREFAFYVVAAVTMGIVVGIVAVRLIPG